MSRSLKKGPFVDFKLQKKIEALSMEDLKQGIVRLYLPSVSVHSLGASLLDDLMYGSMGQFVRQLESEELRGQRHQVSQRAG
jgi:hypothetical protein